MRKDQRGSEVKMRVFTVLSGLSLLFGVQSVAVGSSDIWATPFSTTSSGVAYDFSGHNGTAYALSQEQAGSSVELTQFLGQHNALALRYSQAVEQQDMALGFTADRLTLSYMSGEGENHFEMGGDYSGVDPYLFHGGWHTRFNYNGFAADVRLPGKQHLQYGEATVRADGLQDRTARYLEWSNQRVYARATRFARGGESIGNGFDAGLAFGSNKRLAVQTMFLDQGRSMQRLRLQMDGSQTRQYWLDISSHQNDLYRANDDVQLMFTFKTLLGDRQLLSRAAEAAAQESTVEETDPELNPEIDPATGQPVKKNKGRAILGRALLVGVGVAAAAGGSSSGSPMMDTLTRSRTQHEAALARLNLVNPPSIRENREYGGWVFANPDGSFGSTAPNVGDASSVQLPVRSAVIPAGSVATASYHTHAAFDPQFDNENFSPRDLSNDVESATDGYLATPGGQFKFHDFRTGQVVVLGRVATGG
ncbi:MAG: DUF4329 domain-containing protein [Gammaproteobacteria bacterium]|nr:DUF4329 domain-containing protein [Gammaproteobacteria bacterium]